MRDKEGGRTQQRDNEEGQGAFGIFPSMTKHSCVLVRHVWVQCVDSTEVGGPLLRFDTTLVVSHSGSFNPLWAIFFGGRSMSLITR